MKLGRIQQPDPRNRLFQVVNLTGDQPLISRKWTTFTALNQGQLSACVGFSWSQQIASDPNPVAGVNDTSAITVYKVARTLDDIPGEDYEGTSVLAGIKAIQTIYPELAESYHWAFDIQNMALALGYIGPVVLGINWYSGMFSTDRAGFIHPTGVNVGGHAILCNEVDATNRFFTLKNSWGSSWGVNGSCYISFADMSRLLFEQGEACIPTGKVNFNAI